MIDESSMAEPVQNRIQRRPAIALSSQWRNICLSSKKTTYFLKLSPKIAFHGEAWCLKGSVRDGRAGPIPMVAGKMVL